MFTLFTPVVCLHSCVYSSSAVYCRFMHKGLQFRDLICMWCFTMCSFCLVGFVCFRLDLMICFGWLLFSFLRVFRCVFLFDFCDVYLLLSLCYCFEFVSSALLVVCCWCSMFRCLSISCVFCLW